MNIEQFHSHQLGISHKLQSIVSSVPGKMAPFTFHPITAPESKSESSTGYSPDSSAHSSAESPKESESYEEPSWESSVEVIDHGFSIAVPDHITTDLLWKVSKLKIQSPEGTALLSHRMKEPAVTHVTRRTSEDGQVVISTHWSSFSQSFHVFHAIRPSGLYREMTVGPRLFRENIFFNEDTNTVRFECIDSDLEIINSITTDSTTGIRKLEYYCQDAKTKVRVAFPVLNDVVIDTMLRVLREADSQFEYGPPQALAA